MYLPKNRLFLKSVKAAMKKKNSFKRKLINHEQTYACWIQLGHPLIPDVLAPAGFDCLVVDMEHSSIELNELLPLIVSIESNGIAPLVRIGENNANLIKRVMDIGAYGVIVPNICSVEEAQSAVSAVKYPPIGTRGVGLYRAQSFGRQFDSYYQWVQEESVVIVQIEHINAVACIDEIFSVPGIDAFMIGPYDLSGSLGRPGQFEDPIVQEAIDRILAAGKKHAIPAGYHSVSSDPMQAVQKRKQGFTFLVFGVDFIFLGDHVTSAMKQLKNED